MMKFVIGIWFLPMILSAPWKNDVDCWTMINKTMTNKYDALIKFSPEYHSNKESCSIQMSNAWATNMQNGFGVFFTRAIDCSSSVIVECLPGGTLLQKTVPPAMEYTCHSNASKAEMPCNLIGLTYKRNDNVQDLPRSIDVQVVALAKGPCMDGKELFQCAQDYPNSCINQNLRCNGQWECPSGYDERECYDPSPAGIPVVAVVLAVLAFLVLVCLLSTVLICCCCRAAVNAIVRRLCPSTNKSREKSEIVVATGEDARLMKNLTTPSVLTALPQQNNEPATLIIDSTKPIYPQL